MRHDDPPEKKGPQASAPRVGRGVSPARSDSSARSRILIHAGMGKTGSTAIQRWLARSTGVLARQGLTLVVARETDGPELLRIDPYESGPATSGPVARLLRLGELAPRAVDRLSESLQRQADAHRGVIMTAEGLSQLFMTRDRRFLGALDRLAREHDVRVAYYVRPQHAAIEAGWRQWGFRTGLAPSEYVRRYARLLDHLRTLRGVAEHAPHVDFRMRPFRRDLLESGDVVTDFAAHILEIDPAEVEIEPDSNVGLPLGVVNLLAGLPEGVLWNSPHDNRRLGRLKQLLDGAGGPEEAGLRRQVESLSYAGDRTERGRRVLQRFAHRVFREGNLELLELMGWDAPDWLTDAAAETDEPAALDELWAPPASPAELAALRKALETARLQHPNARAGPPRRPPPALSRTGRRGRAP